MRVELPSGGWVELREGLKAKDKFAVQDSIKFTVVSGQQQEVSAGIQNKMRNALLSMIITSWSLEGVSLPSQARALQGGHLDADEYLGDVFDIDDYNKLAEAVEPLLAKVTFTAPN